MKIEHESKDKLKRVDKYLITAIILILVFVVIEINLLFFQPDKFSIIFCFEGAVTEEAKEAFAGSLENALKTDFPESNVKADVKWVFYDLKDPESLNALSVLLSQSDYTLYILSDQPRKLEGPEGTTQFEGISSLYCSKDWFDPLGAYGIEPDEKYESRALVRKDLLEEQLGITGIDFYTSLIDWYKAGRGEEKDTKYAISTIKYLTQDAE